MANANDRNNQFDQNEEAYENPLDMAPPISNDFGPIFDFDDLVQFINAIHMDILEHEKQKQGPMKF